VLEKLVPAAEHERGGDGHGGEKVTRSGGEKREIVIERIRFKGEWLWPWRVERKDSTKLAALDTCKLLGR
jgi:hypothetical protein